MKKVIGIDIGGTKINSAIIAEDGSIVESYTVATDAHLGRDEVIKRIVDSINKLLTPEILSIGIATAGFIDSENGIIVFAGNITGWTGLNLKEEIEKHVNIPVFVGNDANLAALAEKWVGSAQKYKNFIMLTMGTGLGGAIYDERIGFWEGSHFQGAELGHIVMYPNGRLCTCNQKGCAEKYVAGSSLSINYKELTGLDLKGPEIIERLSTDDNAKKALNKLARDLGIYLSTIKNIFDPEAVIIGGGFINTSTYWWDDAINSYNEYCNRPVGMEIKPAEFLNDAGVIGAGKLAFDKI
ncbi:MAG: ROK family protein [Miniphocaeibacter sp.]|uniref:ROK family protein n=1 Tax=Miniphocaeibacter sp. TaxID=3100973 RepID=UPI0017D17B7B|nr:ROK family protein [Gallicola sp.]